MEVEEMIGKILIGIWLIGIVWCIWEAWNAPVMPDDYDQDYPN